MPGEAAGSSESWAEGIEHPTGGRFGRHWDYKQNGLSTRKALVVQGFSTLAANEVGELWDRSIEEPSFLTLDRPHPGVLELLSTLKRQGFEMVVISARKNLFLLEQQLSYLGLLEYFSRVLVVRAQSDGSEKGRDPAEAMP